MRGGQRHDMPPAIRFEGDHRAGAAGENVGDAAHAIDHDLRVAGSDEDAHAFIIADVLIASQSRFWGACVPARRDGIASPDPATRTPWPGAAATGRDSD